MSDEIKEVTSVDEMFSQPRSEEEKLNDAALAEFEGQVRRLAIDELKPFLMAMNRIHSLVAVNDAIIGAVVQLLSEDDVNDGKARLRDKINANLEVLSKTKEDAEAEISAIPTDSETPAGA